MKRIHILILLSMISMTRIAFSQGWVAEVDLDFNHDLYSFEKITHASLTFSGVTITGSSATSQLQLIVRGTGSMSGNISLSVSGLAWDPYDPQAPESEPIWASFSGNYDHACETGFFEKNGESPQEHIYIWIRIYERMEISSFLQKCDELRLTSNTCSPSFYWEVSDNPNGGFKTISASTDEISVTRESLLALGFSNPFGRKYFRVTGLFHTTSQLQPVEIYYPGPSATLELMPPKCNGGNDGGIRIDIGSAHPQIHDFVITLFEVGQSTDPLEQKYMLDAPVVEFHGLLSGAYMVRIENYTSIDIYGNCWTDHSFYLSNPEPVTIASAQVSDFNGYQLRCHAGNQGRIEVNPAGGTLDYGVFEWTPSISSSAVAANLVEGTYRVRVRDSNLCWSDYYSYELNAPEKIELRLQSSGGKNGYDVSCHNKNDGYIVTDIDGGVTPYDFKWSNGSTDASLHGLGIGSYGLSVTDANGCIVQESLNLTAPDPISFMIAEANPVDCPGNITGALEIHSIRNTIGVVSFTWSSGETQNFITGKSAGLYAATVSDAQGCSASSSHTLKEPEPWSVHITSTSDFHGSPIRCHGEANGGLRAVVTDEAGSARVAEIYSWARSGETLTNDGSLSEISDLVAGVYSVEITYRSTCKATDTHVITEPERVSAAISILSAYNGVPISCAGRNDGSIRATGTGGTGSYEYQWATGESTQTLTNLGANSYAVTVTDINGCQGSAEKFLPEPAPLEPSISILSNFNGQPISCTGASDLHLKGSATGGTEPLSYQWSSGKTSQEITGLPAGVYFLNTLDINGCIGTAEISVPDPTPVSARIAEKSNYQGYGVPCFGSNDGHLVSAGSGGTGKYSFKWAGSLQNTAHITKLAKGDYTVTVTDENGCSHSATGSITEPEKLSLQVHDIRHTGCHNGADGEVDLLGYGGVAKYRFSIDNEQWQDQSTIKGLKAGLYEPVTIDENGCIAKTSVVITEPEPIKIEFNDIRSALCGQAQGKILATVTGGTGTLGYKWKDAKGEIVSEDGEAINLYPGIYTLYASDENGCEASGSAGVSATDGPSTNIAFVSPVTCSYAHDGKAKVEIVGGQGPFSFRWPDGQQTDEATGLRKGIHLVEISDVNRCVSVESVLIPAPDTLALSLSEKVEPSCHDGCDGRLSVTATGGNGHYLFTWKDRLGPSISDLCQGNYEVVVSDLKGCRSSEVFKLTHPEEITATVVNYAPPTCHGACDGKIEISAAGGTGELQYRWKNDETGTTINNLCAGTFHARINDANNCEIILSHTVHDPESPVIELGDPVVLCEGQSHSLDAGPLWHTYLWGGPTGFKSSMRVVQLMEPGEYTVEVKDQSGCIARDTFLLETSEELLQANFLMTSEAIAGDTIVVIDISWPLPKHILWAFPEAMVKLDDLGEFVFGRFDTPGVYDVTLKAFLADCRDELTKTITIIDGTAQEEGAGRLAHDPFVKKFTLYPNPTDGEFDVIVEYSEIDKLTLTIWNALSSKRITHVEDSGSRYYSKHIDLRPLSAGSYMLRLDHSMGSLYIRFIVR